MASFAYDHAPPPPDPDPGANRARIVGQSALGLVGLGALLIAGRAVSIHAPACPLRAVTGVPCPGCGMTRLADAVVHGRFREAAGADLAGVAVLGVLAVVAVTYLVRVVIRKDDPPAWMRSPLLVVGLVALVAIHWVTTIVTGGLLTS
ncbi:DUF2752 domain-containing protein [Aquihabitans daechungensis]|uniref:DUF2752 domain-containing protein n=1 Tax=Aquihabitans daechungensis TaxID=1052257 RepID=UPI003BA0ED4E